MFRTEALRQRIELIIHLIEFGRQLIVIQGAPGLGKTSLLSAIEEAADPAWVFIRVTAGRTSNRDSLLEKIAASLDFEPTERFSEQEIIEEIERRLQILDGNKQKAVLLIDDAEVLPVECHSLLLELAHREDDSTELRVVVAADNSESSVLDQLHAGARQNALIHTVDMPTMDRDQTASLISWWQDQELSADLDQRQRLFSSSTIDEIFEQSAGVPGDILVLARQKWLTGQNVPLRADPAKKYIAFGAVALLLIGLFTFFGKDTKEPEVEELVIELPENPQAPALPTLQESTDSASTNSQSPVEQLATDTGELDGDENEDIRPTPKPADGESILNAKLQDITPSTAPPPLVANDNLGDMLAATIAEEVIADLPQDAPPSEAAAPAPPSDPGTRVDDVAADSAPPPKTVDEPQPAAESPSPKVSIRLRSESGESKATPAPKPVAEKPTKPAPSPKPEAQPAAPPPAPKPQAKPKPPAENYNLAHLLRHSPNGYVLQLFGVRNHDAAAKYLKKHGLEGNSAVVASMHDGEPWYVVIHGQYPTREAAAKAAKSLSKRLDSLKPWPRPIASLK